VELHRNIENTHESLCNFEFHTSEENHHPEEPSFFVPLQMYSVQSTMTFTVFFSMSWDVSDSSPVIDGARATVLIHGTWRQECNSISSKACYGKRTAT
jgi:hypothetical protein